MMTTRFDPFRELDRMASALVAGGNAALRLMPMDLYRTGNQYILSADLPGIDPSSVDIDVDGQLLTIRAERRVAQAENVQWLTRERESGSFLRQLNLGQGIDVAAISARYENGVLEVTIPVSERAKPRRIEIATADGAQDLSPSASDGGAPNGSASDGGAANGSASDGGSADSNPAPSGPVAAS